MLTNVYAEEPVDSVSIPFTSTNTLKANPNRLAFFACSPLKRVVASRA